VILTADFIRFHFVQAVGSRSAISHLRKDHMLEDPETEAEAEGEIR